MLALFPFLHILLVVLISDVSGLSYCAVELQLVPPLCGCLSSPSYSFPGDSDYLVVHRAEFAFNKLVYQNGMPLVCEFFSAHTLLIVYGLIF